LISRFTCSIKSITFGIPKNQKNMSSIKTDYTNQLRVMGHPAGLFVLFFTEMWERFSYYGMRGILVLFLVSASGIGGWEWTNSEALSLYAMYTGLVYITPIFGGMIADRLLGYRKSILIGALLMTLGHGALAFETEFTFYLGLTLLILGNGMFKPNISSIVGGLYNKDPEKKDGGYTIFYMGINAGAFLGMMLCGFLGEIVGWSYGFGLAGVFMLLGMIMFYFSQNIFDSIGLQPKKLSFGASDVYEELQEDEKNAGSFVIDEDKIKKEIEADLPNLKEEDKKSLLLELKDRYRKRIEGDRLKVIGVLAIFTIFFWMAFEQAGGSMTIFAGKYTDRILSGGAATAFTLINTIITIVPLAIITYVLYLLAKNTVKKFAVMTATLAASFLIIWGIIGWKVNKEMNTQAYNITITYDKLETLEDTVTGVEHFNQEDLVAYIGANENLKDAVDYKLLHLDYNKDNSATKDTNETAYIFNVEYYKTATDSTTIRSDVEFSDGQEIFILDVDGDGTYRYVDAEKAKDIPQSMKATVISVKDKEIEIPASWFGILNSLFIILFAPLFSKLWESKYNPSAPIKFALGLILIGVGFGVLAFGSAGIAPGASSASVSIIWLILAYLLHTLGELTLSPVGLSYVSKLSPPKLLSLMFGIWFTATAVANFLAGLMGSFIDKIADERGLAFFFLIFTFVPIIAGVVLIAMRKWMIKKMHGIE
jgi:POT family proton-dependent oligopeptide transporter